MKDHAPAIRTFFEAYERRTNDALKDPPMVDREGVRNAFAPYFVEASPVGIQGGKNGFLFGWMIPRGFARYRKIGTTAMHITRIEVTPIDDLHAMAHVTWDSRYEKDGREIAIVFTNVYMLQMTDDGPKIFAYVTGDEEAVLKAHGLV